MVLNKIYVYVYVAVLCSFQPTEPKYRTCGKLKEMEPSSPSGVYDLMVNNVPKAVYCDMDKFGKFLNNFRSALTLACVCLFVCLSAVCFVCLVVFACRVIYFSFFVCFCLFVCFLICCHQDWQCDFNHNWNTADQWPIHADTQGTFPRWQMKTEHNTTLERCRIDAKSSTINRKTYPQIQTQL